MPWCVILPLPNAGCLSPAEAALFFGAISAALSCAIAPFITRWATKKGVVDKPEAGRKKQGARVPLLGGWAVAAAVAFGLLLLVSSVFGGPAIPSRSLFGLFAGALILCVGGYLDDRFCLRPWQQILFPVGASLVAVACGVHIPYIRAPWSGEIVSLEAARMAVPWGTFFWPADPLTFFWLLGLTYTTKFLDSVDGLVSGVTAIAAIMMVFVALRPEVGQPMTAALAAIVAGAFLGFLPWNWSPARQYLGESGSVLAGFSIAVLAVISGSKVATALLLFGIPLLDVFWVIIQRVFILRTSPTKGDRRHLPLRLIDAGVPARRAVLLFYALSFAFGLVGVVGTTQAKALAFGLLVVLMAVTALVLFRDLNRKRL